MLLHLVFSGCAEFALISALGLPVLVCNLLRVLQLVHANTNACILGLLELVRRLCLRRRLAKSVLL